MSFAFLRCTLLSVALVLVASVRAAGADQTLTDEECAAFGKQVASWLSTHNITAFQQSFDPLALLDRATKGFDLSDQEAGEFRGGALSEMQNNLWRQLAQIKKAQFLHVVQRSDGKRPLVRVQLASGLNYYEFVCAHRANGKLKWIDMFVYAAGDMMSNVIRTAALPAIVDAKKSILERLTGEENSYVKHLPDIHRAVEFYYNKQYAQAEALLTALPPEVRSNHSVLLIRLQAAQATSRDDYLTMIKEWERAYPHDPALALISIDGDVLQKNYNGALGDVDELDRLVGGDPYLNCIRGNIYLAAKNYPAAKRSAQAALQADRTFFSAYDTLLNASLAEENYDETVGILENFERTFPKANMAAAIKGDAAYAKFRLSPQYAQWLVRRAQGRGGVEAKP